MSVAGGVDRAFDRGLEIGLEDLGQGWVVVHAQVEHHHRVAREQLRAQHVGALGARAAAAGAFPVQPFAHRPPFMHNSGCFMRTSSLNHKEITE